MSLRYQPDRVFNKRVATRYRLYSGLFLGLPYELLQRAGRLLPLFAEHCQRGLSQHRSPTDIVESFFLENTMLSGVSMSDALFLFLQLVERQVVLFDALEDASFAETHDLAGSGSVTQLLDQVLRDDRRTDLQELLHKTATRIVLTAHPTQFYPDTVQGIIQDLRAALVQADAPRVEQLLLQLGKTRFSNRQKPTPVDEARSVLSTLEEVFYEELPQIVGRMFVAAAGREPLHQQLPERPNLQVGFWPGGDRDGNPFVTSEVTRNVAALLKERVLERHVATLASLARRLTFDGVHDRIVRLLERLRQTWLNSAGREPLFSAGNGEQPAPFASARELLDALLELREVVVEQHQGLFVDELDDFIIKVHLFGFHFASLDLRQSSEVCFAAVQEIASKRLTQFGVSESTLDEVAATANAEDVPMHQLQALTAGAYPLPHASLSQLAPLSRDLVEVLQLLPLVQERNGELGLHRFIISHTRCAQDALVVLFLARCAGIPKDASHFDIVPLFESIDDLQNSQRIMEEMFDNPLYFAHVKQRPHQVVMVGFSDGTKDGGYLTANWQIREAKRRLTALGRQRGIPLVFFDGRGGPPARGGGNTHQFYRSRDMGIEQLQNQLTIQGQTISSNFGSREMGRYHIEQLYTANLENLLYPATGEDPPVEFRPLADRLATVAHDAYRQLRDDPKLLDFLADVSPLPLFDRLTIASRPVSRRRSKTLELSQLRAIPFVATFSVLKIQIPGYFGLGTALDRAITDGHLSELERMYRESRFFRALLENAAMSLLKSRFDITSYLSLDERFARLWQQLHDEASLTERCILQISHQPWLLYNDPLNRESIRLREDIVLPLLVIVHHAVAQYNQLNKKGTDSTELHAAQRMALKGIAAVINATRNAA